MKRHSYRIGFGLLVALLSVSVRAVELISPIDNAEVDLVPKVQRHVMALPTLAERLAAFTGDGQGASELRRSKDWGRAQPLVLTWRAGSGERGPWKVSIGRRSDLSDARVEVLAGRPNTNGIIACVFPRANLLLGTRYHWQVSCVRQEAGWSFEGERALAAATGGCSAVGTFTTADTVPRWIEIEGRVKNIRDLGGRIGLNGCRVRQGMIFRGQGLNDNSPAPGCRGRNRLTVEDVDYLTRTLGIRTDLDLRTKQETCRMEGSPLGRTVRLVSCDSESYRGMFSPKGKKAMAEAFRAFCDRANYPIYFHCISGASRTGSLAYVLNGILGVSRQELETDWESTYYPDIPDADPNPDRWNRESHFNDGFARYGAPDDTWGRRIELYLLECGIQPEEIAAFREIMLEQRFSTQMGANS